MQSIQANAPAQGWEAVVVDSGSTDGSHSFLRASAQGPVRLVALDRNVGFTAAINLGFRQTTGEKVLILNPDMVALEGSLDALLRHMEQEPSLGAVGGHCVRPDGAFEWRYVHRLPTPWDLFVFCFVPPGRAERLRSYRRYALLDEDFSRPVEVEQPAGGCLMVRRSLFPADLASQRFGIYWSDVEIARRIRDAGFGAKVFPDARFVHDHDPLPADPRLGRLLRTDFYVGALRYFRTYHGRWGGAWAKALLLSGILWRTCRKAGAVVLRREPRDAWRDQVAFLRDFLRGRNPFLGE